MHIKVHVSQVGFISILAAGSIFLAGCNAEVVRVWSDANGGGSNRNFAPNSYFSDLRNDQYENIVNEQFMDDNISGVANFSGSWIKFARDQDGWAGFGPSYCFPPHRYFPDLTNVNALVLEYYSQGIFGASGWAYRTGVSINDLFSSYIGSFQGDEEYAQRVQGCHVILRDGMPL